MDQAGVSPGGAEGTAPLRTPRPAAPTSPGWLTPLSTLMLSPLLLQKYRNIAPRNHGNTQA